MIKIHNPIFKLNMTGEKCRQRIIYNKNVHWSYRYSRFTPLVDVYFELETSRPITPPNCFISCIDHNILVYIKPPVYNVNTIKRYALNQMIRIVSLGVII